MYDVCVELLFRCHRSFLRLVSLSFPAVQSRIRIAACGDEHRHDKGGEECAVYHVAVRRQHQPELQHDGGYLDRLRADHRRDQSRPRCANGRQPRASTAKTIPAETLTNPPRMPDHTPCHPASQPAIAATTTVATTCQPAMRKTGYANGDRSKRNEAPETEQTVEL